MDEIPEGEFVVCETCRRPVDPANPDLIRATEIIRLTTSEGSEEVEGFELLFHPACWRPSPRYRRKG